MVSEAQEGLTLSGVTFQCKVRGGMRKMEPLLWILGVGMVVRECFLKEALGLSAEARRTGRSWLETDR